MSNITAMFEIFCTIYLGAITARNAIIQIFLASTYAMAIYTLSKIIFLNKNFI